MAILNANGKILKANGKILGKQEGSGDTVVIGNRAYPYKRFGNLYWLTENLKESVGTNAPPAGNPANVESKGLLYRLSTMMSLPNKVPTTSFANLIPNGWRIPTASDVADLFASVGGESVAYRELAKEESGFNLTYPGYYSSYIGYTGFNNIFYFAMTGEVPSYFYQTYSLMDYRTFYQSFSGEAYVSLRLVKNAT